MLKNFIYTIVASAAMAASLASCSEENFTDPTPDPVGEGNVTLTFTNATASRAASDEWMNENLISKLDLFFYTADATNTESPVAQRTVTGLTAKGTAQIKVSLSKQETDALFNGGTAGATCRMVAIANRPAGVDLPADIAGMTVEALRNIIVGSKFATQDGETPQESFVMFGDTDEERAGNTDITFATGDFGGTASGNVMLVRAAARIHFTAEIRDQVEVTETSSDGTTTTEYWRPKTNEISIILNNGVANSTVEPSTATAIFDKNYFTLPAVNGQFSPGNTFDVGLTHPDGTPVLNDDGTQKKVSYTEATSKSVFYTYPNQWEISPSETHRTTLTIALPWQKYEVKENGELGEVSTFRTCYYKVPMTRGTEIVRNTDYSVTLRIDMLGSFTIEEPMEVDGSYETVDWSKVQSDVSIKDYRYLVVNQNNFTIDNAPSISIPFYSSHPVEVKSIVMRYKRFNTQSNGNGDVATITVTEAQNDATGTNNNGQKVFTYQITKDAAGNNVLVVNHELKAWRAYGNYQTNNNRPQTTTGIIPESDYYSSIELAESTLNGAQYYTPTDGIAYSPYEFIVTIVHSDEKNNDQTHWQETLTITQYPGMYIEVDPNPGTPSTRPSTDAQYGYVWVNAVRNRYGYVHGLTGDNKNPNMYVISINTLNNDDNQYIIDDPRFFYINNLNSSGNSALGTATTDGDESNWSSNSAALYPNTTNRVLKYYYPTREATEYSYVIAPKIRIASSYGVTTELSRNNARRRCAAYQEAGRPAGRWRVPTLGEMQFIVNLSRSGKIPTLFTQSESGGGGETQYYWSAQGRVKIPANATDNLIAESSTSSYPVRCVYDEWYWEKQDEIAKTVNLTTFTWGDMKKANPEGGVK